MSIEIQLQSNDAARPNEALLQQILARQQELEDFVKQEEPEVEGVTVEPPAAFPTGLETIAVVVAWEFGKGFLKGLSGKLGEEAGRAAGERIGKRVRLWIEQKFPDVVVKDPPKK